MTTAEIRNRIQKELVQSYLAGMIPTALDWDLETILPPFEFNEPIDDKNCTYKLTNRETNKSYRIHYQKYSNIHIESHRCWWYNFDDWFETESEDEIIKHLVLWICRLINNNKEIKMGDNDKTDDYSYPTGK